MAEHRAAMREGVELAALAARIDRGRQLVEQARVEFASHEYPIQDLWVHTRQARAQSARYHFPRQRCRVRAEQRKERRQAAAREPLFAIAADVLEKEIAERHVGESRADGPRDGLRHRTLVD